MMTRPTMTTERVRSSWLVCRSGTQKSAPRKNPSQNPPKVRICTSAPSRRPWTAASSINPMISRSIQSTMRG